MRSKVWAAVAVLGLALPGLALAEYQYSEDPDQPNLIRKDIKKFSANRLQWINAVDLAAKIKAREAGQAAFHLVDLRIEADYNRQHIEGAVNVPYSKLRFVAETMFAWTDEVIVYGHTSKDPLGVNAVVLLVNKGYDQVYILRGGMRDWDESLLTSI